MGRVMGSLVELIDFLAICVSIFSLAISAITFWLTSLRRGKLICLHPLSIHIGKLSEQSIQVMFRQLCLASTGFKGVFLESLCVAVSRNTSRQIFDVWVHGKGDDLVRSSGAKVSEDGFISDHYFLLGKDAEHYRFEAGKNQIELFAKVWGKSQPMKVFSVEVWLSDNEASALQRPNTSVNCDWSQEEQKYINSIKNEFMGLT